jgi:hypothetical protein
MNCLLDKYFEVMTKPRVEVEELAGPIKVRIIVQCGKNIELFIIFFKVIVLCTASLLIFV